MKRGKFEADDSYTRGSPIMKISSLRTPLTICLLLVAACGQETAIESGVAIYDDEAIADESRTGNWLA